MARKTMTPEARKAYTAEMRAQLEQIMTTAYSRLETSPDAWADLMSTAVALTRNAVAGARTDRSPVNCIAITAQCPGATDVRSAGDWRKAGRYPAKGSRAIRIWTPVRYRNAAPTAEHATPADASQADQSTETVTAYKAGPCFDISQTEGTDVGPDHRPTIPAAEIAGILATNYQIGTGEAPEWSEASPERTALDGLFDQAQLEIPEAPDMTPGQWISEVVSVVYVAARILGLTPPPALHPPMSEWTTLDRKPPIHHAAVRVITAGRAIAQDVIDTAGAPNIFGDHEDDDADEASEDHAAA
ncbi:hypothetical protein ACN20G_11895 [Streptomyces sp. BI20]|uniref:hypothetical protein n=1 Tax=Streptomyces sp. BI20 TaxID=3403460 RepID=UPI003C7280B4